ncbi:MAG: DUF3280 domain-containing protein [Bradyrhizobium sp.]
MKLLAIALVALLLPIGYAEAAPAKLMVFDFYLDNTSLTPTTDAEKTRLKRISKELRDVLQKSGQYDVAPGPDVESAAVQSLGKCTDEQVAAAKKAGFALVACPWVQKVSNLILNLNIFIEDLKTDQVTKGGSVDIRGNTDNSWDHGVRYLVKEHVLPKK